MGDVLLTSSVRASLAQMRFIRTQIDAAQKRLATGKRVDSPIDDPAAYFTSSSLRSRASDLATLLTSMTSAQSTVTAASQGLDSIETLLNSARSSLIRAMQTESTMVTVTATNSSALTA